MPVSAWVSYRAEPMAWVLKKKDHKEGEEFYYGSVLRRSTPRLFYSKEDALRFAKVVHLKGYEPVRCLVKMQFHEELDSAA